MTVVRKKGWLLQYARKQFMLTESSDDEEDEAAELMRELEKIKKERQEQKEKEERERAAEEEEQREVDIARGNPLLNTQDFNLKRRWDDDVVFKNQARGTEDKRGKEFVNVSAAGLLLLI
jgi:protein CWC15